MTCSICGAIADGAITLECSFGLLAAWCVPPSGWSVLVGPPPTEDEVIVDVLCPVCTAEKARRHGSR